MQVICRSAGVLPAGLRRLRSTLRGAFAAARGRSLAPLQPLAQPPPRARRALPLPQSRGQRKAPSPLAGYAVKEAAEAVAVARSRPRAPRRSLGPAQPLFPVGCCPCSQACHFSSAGPLPRVAGSPSPAGRAAPRRFPPGRPYLRGTGSAASLAPRGCQGNGAGQD